jgi:DNA polymerase III sliding clamp (beta) subunit (PCNA family)
MKFRLQREQAKKAISYILSVVTDPLILLSANAETQKVVFEGASTGVYIRVAYDAPVATSGIVSVNGPHLATYKFHADVDFSCAPGENKLCLTSGSFSGAIALEEGGGFIKAQRARPTDAPWVRVSRSLLTRAITAAVFEPTVKTPFDGVVVMLGPKDLVMHVRDGVKAAIYKSPLDEPTDTQASFVVSPKVFDAIKKIPGTGDTVDLSVDRGIITVRTDSVVVRYPQLQIEPFDLQAHVDPMLARTKSGAFQIHTKRLGDAVGMVASVVRGGVDYNQPIVFEVTEDSLRVSMSSPHGEGTESVLLEGDVTPCRFMLSSKYVAELLPHMSGDAQVWVYPEMIIVSSCEGQAMHLLSTFAG